jgi:tRNA dimethylallyltransferase
MNTLLVICGPTATGKTKLATSLAKKFNGELVSSDSRQVYKLMNIGTGKDLPVNPKIIDTSDVVYNGRSYGLPAYDLGSGVPIWMYDVVYPNEEFSVSHYYHITRAVIETIQKRNRLPILVGGTGFYIDSILNPPKTLDVPINPVHRETYKNATVETLQKSLKDIDNKTFMGLNNSDRNNPRRLLRKIEIALFGGVPSQFGQNCNYDAHIIGLTRDVKELFSHIDERVDERLKQGMLKEVEMLISSGYPWSLPAMSSLGYSQWKIYFEGSALDRESLKQLCITRWKQDEHKYAKRQLTWFKNTKDIHWFDVADSDFEKMVTKSVASWYT